MITAKRQMVRLAKAGDPCTIQDLYLEECLLGARLAESCTSVSGLREILEEQLPQNSPQTRSMYALRICGWLFPDDSLESAPSLAWRAHHDQQILLDHFRVRYLEAVPLLGRFAAGPLALLEVGGTLGQEAVEAFVSRECGAAIPKTTKRVSTNLRKLGFLARNGKGHVRTVPTYDRTSVALELHRYFSPEPTTVPFEEIIAHPFWRLVGVPDVGALERMLYDAVGQGILTKFVKSDELNQVTTGMSYRELLESGRRMI